MHVSACLRNESDRLQQAIDRTAEYGSVLWKPNSENGPYHLAFDKAVSADTLTTSKRSVGNEPTI